MAAVLLAAAAVAAAGTADPVPEGSALRDTGSGTVIDTVPVAPGSRVSAAGVPLTTRERGGEVPRLTALDWAALPPGLEPLAPVCFPVRPGSAHDDLWTDTLAPPGEPGPPHPLADAVVSSGDAETWHCASALLARASGSYEVHQHVSYVVGGRVFEQDRTMRFRFTVR